MPVETVFRSWAGETRVHHRFGRDGALEISVDGEPLLDPRLRGCSPDAVDLEVAGIRRRYRVSAPGRPGAGGATYDVDSALGHTVLVEVDRFPVPAEEAEAGSLVAPLAGVVVAVEHPAGTAVTAGSRLVVIESMKVEYPVTAPEDGTLSEVRVGVGERVEAGAVLAVVEPAATM